MNVLELEKYHKSLLTLLFFGVLIGAIDIAIVGPAMPSIKSYFNLDVSQSSWIFNAFLIAHLVSVPLFAKLSDTYGRKNIYIINISLFAAGSLIVFFSNSYDIFLVGRVIQGFGAGGILPVASAIIGDNFPIEKQGSILGIIGAVFGLAFIIGPILAGILLLYNWHLIFLVNIIPAIIIIFFASKILKNKIKEKNLKFDFVGVSLLSIIIIFFAYSLSKLKSDILTEKILDLNIIIPLSVSIILTPIFYLHQKKIVNPIINTKLLKSKSLRLTYFIGIMAGFLESSSLYVPLFAKEIFDISYSQASFMLLPMVFAMLIGAPVAGRLIDKKGVENSITIGTVNLLIGLINFILFGNNIVMFYISGIGVGFGLAFLLGAPLRYLINREVPAEYRASGQGLVTISTSIGKITSAAILGAILTNKPDLFFAFREAFSLLIVASLIIIFLTIRLKRIGYNNK